MGYKYFPKFIKKMKDEIIKLLNVVNVDEQL